MKSGGSCGSAPQTCGVEAASAVVTAMVRELWFVSGNRKVGR